MSSTEPRKHRIYIVGGKGKNIPPWIDAAFEWEQFAQDNAKTRTLEPDKTPDAVVVLKSWVGHEHFYGARALAERLGVPMILSPGGWSSSLKAAADLGVNWFIADINASRSSDDLEESQIEELDEFIDNAWREAYEREYEAREALEKRYGKDRKRFERAQRDLTRLTKRDEAAQRVIGEIRAAAAAQRLALDEIQARNARVAEALVHHMGSLVDLFGATELSYDSLVRATSHLSDARGNAAERLAILRASLIVAEDGPPKGITADEPTVASNAGVDS